MWPKCTRLARTLLASSACLLLSSAAAAGQALHTASPAAVGAPVASRLTQPIDEKQLVTLKGTVHPLANARNDRGAAEDSKSLERIEILLKRSNAQETALRQLIQDLHTPGTASYHQWLTPQQFGKQFGPSDSDIATLSAWLQSKGFSVTKVSNGRQSLVFSGTAGQFRNAFHAQIHKYVVNGETHYANASDPQIPAALSPVFGGFAPLNNFRVKSQAKVMGKAEFNPATHKATPSWTTNLDGGEYLVLAPGDFAVQYDLSPLYNAGTNGSGEAIGIINDANISVALVNQYRSLYGLPANAPTVIVDGNDPGIDGVNNPDGPSGDSIEAYLDVEQAGSVAPNATIDLVIAADTTVESGLNQAAERAVDSNVAPVLSLSFGECEGMAGTENAFFNTLWEQAAAQGQTVMVSTGDSAAASCDDPSQEYAIDGQTVSGFASTPWNVAVGGTDFYYSTYAETTYSSTGATFATAQTQQLQQYWNLTASTSSPVTSLLARVPEQPWNNSQFGLNLLNNYDYSLAATGTGATTISGGSGGASNCSSGIPAPNEGVGGSCQGYAKPSWQTGTGVPADGVRDLPDVSLFAANGNNLTLYGICAGDGDCQPVGSGGTVQITGVGGTSASSPAFAGIMALVNQKYGRQGQADFVLYPLAAQYGSSFHDVTVGSNTVPCSLNPSTPDCIAAPTADTYTVDDTNFYGTAVEGQIGTGTTAEYNAGTGYDLASGLGSVDAANLVNNWNKVTFTSTTTALTLPAAPYSPTTALSISGTVTPASGSVSGGFVTLMTTSSEPLQAGQGVFPVTNGAYSGTVSLPGGTYTVYASYSGNGTDGPSTSTPASITVGQAASSVTLTALNELGNTAATSGSSVSYGTQLLMIATPTSSTGARPTGTVTFTDNGTTIGVATISASGTAVLNWAPAVSTTAHSLTAAYSGDSSYAASTSSPFTLTVTRNTPDLNLFTSGEATNVFGGVSGETAFTVVAYNSGTDGIVNNTNVNEAYSAGSPVLAPTGVVTLTGLPATLTFPALQPGIDAVQSVGLNFGSAQTFGTAVANVPSSYAAGNYNVTINYPGDANYAPATSSGTIQIATGVGAATTISAVPSSASTSPLSPITVTVTITGQAGDGVPTGSVSFQQPTYDENDYNLATYTLPATGTGDSVTFTATLNSGNLAEGTNVISVQYSGSNVYAASVTSLTVNNGSNAFYTLSNSGPVAVAAGSNGTSNISVTPTGGFTGSVALSCVVTPAAASSTPTCSVGVPASITGLSPVTATLTVNTTATTSSGTYVVTVTGTSGSQVFTTSVPVVVSSSTTTGPSISLSNSGSINVVQGATTGNTSTITVTPTGGFTGVVALSCAVTPTTGTSVPVCTINPPSVTTSGTATLTVTTTSTTTTGSYTVTVSATNASVATATTAVSVTVTATNPAVALTAGSSITISAPGGSGTSTIAVTPSGGFSGAVTLSCSVTPTTETDTPTCSITSPVTVSGTTAGSATLTVNTTAASASLSKPRFGWLPLGGGVAMATLLFFVVPGRRRRLGTLLGAVVLMAFVGFAAGCGGGGTPVTTPPPGSGGTTTGAYTVTVSGTATGVTIAPVTVSVTVN